MTSITAKKIEIINRMRQQCVSGSLFLLPPREPGYEANDNAGNEVQLTSLVPPD